MSTLQLLASFPPQVVGLLTLVMQVFSPACSFPPQVVGLLTLSLFLGLWMMVFSLVFYIFGFSVMNEAFKHEEDYRETVVYLQVEEPQESSKP